MFSYLKCLEGDQNKIQTARLWSKLLADFLWRIGSYRSDNSAPTGHLLHCMSVVFLCVFVCIYLYKFMFVCIHYFYSSNFSNFIKFNFG